MPYLFVDASPRVAEILKKSERFRTLIRVLAPELTVPLRRMKVTVHAGDFAMYGDEAAPDYLYATLHLFRGRSLEVRQRVADLMTHHLEQDMRNHLTTLVMSVYVVEVDPETSRAVRIGLEL